MEKLTTYFRRAVIALLLVAALSFWSSTSGQGAPPPSPVLVRDVDNPGRQPFGKLFRCDLPAGAHTTQCNFTSPSGSVLVVETLSAFANPPIGHRVGYQFIYTSDNVNQAAITVTLTDALSRDGVIDDLAGTQSVRLYVFPGSTMTLAVGQSSTSATPFGVTLSGYLVECGIGPGCPLP